MNSNCKHTILKTAMASLAMMLLPLSLAAQGQLPHHPLAMPWRPAAEKAAAHWKAPMRLNQVSKALSGTELWTNLAYEAWWDDTNQPIGIYAMDFGPAPSFSPLSVDSFFTVNGGMGIQDDALYTIYQNQRSAGLGILFTYMTVYDIETFDTIAYMESVGNELWAQATAEDYTTQTIYAETVNDDYSSYVLATMDYAAQSRTVIGNLTQAYAAMGFNASDRMLYGISLDNGRLYRIDPQTARETAIGSTGLRLSDANGGYYPQSGVITTDGTFFWASVDINANCAFYTVDLTNGHPTKVADNPMYDLVYAMAQPVDNCPTAAPSKVTALSASFDGPSLTGTVAFTAPTLTNDGQPLVGDITYSIRQGRDIIATGTTQPGALTEASVTVAEGQTNLAVFCSNSAGKGPNAHIGLWAGYDKPDRVQEPTATIDNAKGTVGLTWQAPWRTLHYAYQGHYLYNIYRYEDKADGTHRFITVATGVDALQYEDRIPHDTLTEYTYGVTCVNGDQESLIALANHVVGGTPNEAPYFYTFPSTQATRTWVTRDDNGDGQTWEWMKIHGAFGAPYAENGNDDWIISPPFQLRPGRTYTLRYHADEDLPNDTTLMEVRMGQARQYLSGEMTTQLSPVTEYTDSSPKNYRIDFTVPAEGEYNFGFHNVSRPYKIGAALDSIQLAVEPVGEAPDSVTHMAIAPAADASVRTDITFRTPTKAINGEPLASLSKVTVRREHTLLHTFTDVKPGEELSFTDDQVENGWHRYYINAYNSADIGRTATDSVFVGADEPLPPTNLRVTDNTTSIRLDWDAPALTGAHGQRVNPEKVEYAILPVDRNGSSTGQAIHQTGSTTLTIDGLNTNEGPASHLYWEIYARTTGGESLPLEGGLDIGAPYTLPFTESFANYNYEKVWWNSAVSAEEWMVSNIQPSWNGVDEDNGCAIASSWITGDQMWLHSGKISVKGAADPHLYFYHKGSDVTFSVEVTRKNASEPVTIATFNDNNEYGDYELADVPLSDFANDDYFYLAFKAVIDQGGGAEYFDDINITDASAAGLALSFDEMPATLKRGQTGQTVVRVRNTGAQAVGGYRLQVRKAEEVVADTTVSEPLRPFLVQLISAPLPTSTATGDGDTLQVYANAETGGQSYGASATVALTDGYGVPVGNIKIAMGDDRRVSLTWDEPGAYEEPVTDGFESYSVGDTEFGPWTLIDGNQGWACPLFQDKDYWGQNQQFAYVIFNPTFMGSTMVDDYPFLAPHSGEQYAAVPYECTWDGAYIDGDNWLISPRLSGKEQTIDFWTHCVWYNATDSLGQSETYYMPEQYVVLASTQPSLNGTEGFQAVTDTIWLMQTTWKHEQVTLPEGTTFFAIHQVSDGDHNSLFGLDDITYRVAGPEAVGYRVYRDYVLVDSIGATAYTDPAAYDTEHFYQVTAVYPDGSESQPVGITLSLTGLQRVVVDAQHPADVYTLDGRLLRRQATTLRGLQPGVYVVDGRKLVVR